MENGQNSEKVSVNINVATLASIDMLVDNGFFSNRSDFINQAVREALIQRQSTLDDIAERNRVRGGAEWFVGVYAMSRRELEKLEAAGAAISLRGYGVLKVDSSIPEELLYKVVDSIAIRGRVVAPASVKEHYGLK